ncbi:energy-coupling factor transporter ATPase [Lottiidibacillus patelloidae]|uniref:Energy-coupling factor transporter ATP-binding protein EcfA2 n=1 Tax=Lottiidibacillus patelloidae TaxID=2670334 RepID=A0A263BQS5_9BACI|nr:energy-coupling factor transporter ATPase [Lottiidibacillus patelloidae]OZM55932.1 energy-coupling factor transporter ATPase [Lottiidibacillus patelloidae]
MQININNISHIYEQNSPFERKALHNVSVNIEKGQYVAVVGQTGSGKSTLVQHINGLLLPSEGSIQVGDFILTSKTKKRKLKPLREKVGYVFQNPEQQLFEETVEKEVLFGLLNFGYTMNLAKKRAHEALALVGIKKEFFQVSPFHLSGGQMRRVAIASILALKPEVLILDEPTAGLDSTGRKEVMELFAKLNKEKQTTIILVTHQMEDVAKFAEKVFVMQDGKLIAAESPQNLFYNDKFIANAHLDIPETISFMKKFDERTNRKMQFKGLTIEEAANYIQRVSLNKE